MLQAAETAPETDRQGGHAARRRILGLLAGEVLKVEMKHLVETLHADWLEAQDG